MEKWGLREIEAILKFTQLLIGKDKDSCLFWLPVQLSFWCAMTDQVIYGACYLCYLSTTETAKDKSALPLDSHCMRIKSNDFFFLQVKDLPMNACDDRIMCLSLLSEA